MNDNSNLNGLKVLVVEDEMLVSMLVEDMLADLGCTVVGPAAEIEAVSAQIVSAAEKAVGAKLRS